MVYDRNPRYTRNIYIGSNAPSSYCALHGTYPALGEPCWQCANPFIARAYERGRLDVTKEQIEGKEQE